MVNNMAKAKKLPSGSWRCQVFSHWEHVNQQDGTISKKRIYKSFTCDISTDKGKRICENMAAAWAVDKENISHANLTLGEATDEYIEKRSAVLSPSTIREYKRSRRRDLRGLMDRNLHSITQVMIQNEINQEALNHSPKTVKNMHGLLSAVMGAYRPDFTIRTDLPKKVRPKIYVPSDGDVTALMDVVRDTPLEIPVLLAAFGPMRRGEICALDSNHVNGNIVHVEFSMALNDKNEWIIKRPKSFAGDRYIEFPDFVITKIKGKEGRITELLPSQISDHFAEIIKKAGIPHFRFHDLRHYSASIQHSLGIPDIYIMQRGGWGNDGVLKSVYRHAMEDQAATMNQKANNHFANLCNTKCNTT